MRSAGYPMGPFELMDLTGIDVTLAAARGIHEGFVARDDPLADRFRPSEIQEQLVEAGRLGRKAGAGFYAYDGAAWPVESAAETLDPPSSATGSSSGSSWRSSTRRIGRATRALPRRTTSIGRCGSGLGIRAVRSSAGPTVVGPRASVTGSPPLPTGGRASSRRRA